MDQILSKISSYNLFNYFFPGIIFVFLTGALTEVSLHQNDILTALFFYYFLGMIISRIGSLVVEPLFKKLGFIKYEDYISYLKLVKENESTADLLEVRNVYRSLIVTIVLVLLIRLSELSGIEFLNLSFANINSSLVALGMLVLIFSLSFIKQNNFIRKRVNAVK